MRTLFAVLVAFAACDVAVCETAPVPEDFAPRQAPLPVPPPANATILLGEAASHQFLSMAGGPIDWRIEDGSLVSTRGNQRSNHLVSKVHFSDADIHVEFILPKEGSGNSGIYIHGHYELQIFNSCGKQKLGMGDMGAVYAFSKPLLNAAREPGQWQVYDIRYRAPRRNDEGQVETEGSITAWLNGQKVQDRARVGEPRSKYHPFRYGATPYLQAIEKRQKRTLTGPLFLQDHDSPVRFRNVWVAPLDNRLFVYEGE